MWINPETLALSDEPAEGYEYVIDTQCPLTARLEKAVPGAPELVDGMWQQTWVIEPLTDDEVAQVEEAEQANLRSAWKAARGQAVGSIVVEVDGMKFDGDETSQTRMARSISVMTDDDTTIWVLATNTPVQVTKSQLSQVLRLAGQRQTELWVAP